MKTVKFLSTLIALAMLGFSCGGDDGPSTDTPEKPDPGKPKTLTLSVSPLLITSNGQDAATFQVLSDGQAVTDGVVIYDAKTNKPLNLTSMRFTTTSSGKYKFWATYKTVISNTVEIEAVPELPDAPADPNPASTDFKRRVLLTQFTGTNCPYCPWMVLTLHSLQAQSPYDTDVVVAAAHLFNTTDPAYLSTARLDQAMAVSGFPTVVIDMNKSNQVGNYSNVPYMENKLKEGIAKTLQTETMGGIAVSSTLDGNTLMVRATVKSAKATKFSVGAWLLEDGIYGKQVNSGAPETTPGQFDTHNNCIRIADSKVSSTNYTGYSLGTIEKGAIAEKVFTMTLDDSWKKDKCHLVVFITVNDQVNNTIKAKIGEQVAFEYN